MRLADGESDILNHPLACSPELIRVTTVAIGFVVGGAAFHPQFGNFW
jgi:hypothetical protein